MATLVSDLIYHAYRLAGIQLAPDRKASPAMTDDGVRAFSRLISTYNILAETVYTRRIDQFPTVGGKQLYTYGTGGDWDAPRPAKVTDANFIFNTDPDVRRPLTLWDEEDWSDLRLQEVYTIPTGVYIDGSSPLRNVRFYPIPDVTYQIEIYSWQPVSSGTIAATDTVAYPDGYEQAIVFNLARVTMPMYRKRLNTSADDQLVIAEATNSIARLARINAYIPRLQGDPDISSKGMFLYNWLDAGTN
jgi:hypothetical protein